MEKATWKGECDVKMNPQALAGSVVERLLKVLKSADKPFAKMNEATQQAFIDQMGKDALELVEDVIEEMTETGGLCSINALVKNVTVKDDVISGTVTIDRNDENADLYVHAAHKPCKLAFAKNREKMTNLGDTPKAEPDQPAMFTDDDKPAPGSQPKSAEVEETVTSLDKRRRTRAARKAEATAEEEPLANLAGD